MFKRILFLICFIGAVCFTIVAEHEYMGKVAKIDVEFKKPAHVISTLMIDSDVTRSVSKFVFMARDVLNDERYKVTAPPDTEVQFGDCVRVTGTVSLPKIKSSSGDGPLYNFPYREYLAKDSVYLLMTVKNIEHVSSCNALSTYSSLKLYLILLKDKLTKIFLIQYEQPYAGLVAGVLIAGKGLLDADSLELFKMTSLSHVVVLSGSNVSLILVCIKMLVDKLFFWRKEKGWVITVVQKIIIFISVWVFMLLTGGGAPIYRAVASAYCGLLLFQAQTSQVYALTIVIFIMTMISPFQTLYDPSFHLTCCATFGLILYSKSIDSWMRLSRLRFIPSWLREIISVTLATQVFVFPYIVYMTASFSSVFLLSNVLVLPLIPLIMLFGFITLCSDVLGITFLLKLVVFVNTLLLHAVFYVVEVLAGIPHAYIVLTKTASIVVLVVYCLLLAFIQISSLRPRS